MTRRPAILERAIGGQRCLDCHELLNRAAGPSSKPPAPGDVTLCVYCGAALVFGDGLALRRPTAAEQAWMDRQPFVRNAQAALQSRAARAAQYRRATGVQ